MIAAARADERVTRRVAILITVLGARPLALLAAGGLVLGLLAALVVVTTGSSAEGRVSTPFLSYAPPPGWTADPAAVAAPPDVPALTGIVHGPGYDCGGESHLRGFAAAALLPTDGGSGPTDRADRLARWFATASYTGSDGRAAEIAIAPPRMVQVAGPDGPVEGTVTEVTATTAGTGGCAATAGTVVVLAAPVSGGAAAVLLVAADTDGGPAEPAPPERAALDAVLAGVRLGT